MKPSQVNRNGEACSKQSIASWRLDRKGDGSCLKLKDLPALIFNLQPRISAA